MMMSEKKSELKDRSLRQLLDGIVVAQRQDIHAFSGGHLNEANLNKPAGSLSYKSWASANKPMVLRQYPPRPPRDSMKEQTMKDTMFSFSIGTTGYGSKPKKPAPRGTRSPVKVERKQSVESQGSYSRKDDGVLVEEVKLTEAMLPRSYHYRPKAWAEENLEEAQAKKPDNPLSSIKDQNLAHRQHAQLMPSHMQGVTKKDQFNKMVQYENKVLRKPDTLETNVLSGTKAVEHLENKLKQDLESLPFNSYGPNFHRLQVYSNIFEDLNQDSATFGFILRTIKKEYDDYVALLLDGQTAKHRVLYDQVEQMSRGGGSNTRVLHGEMDMVHDMEQEAKRMLDENERLRKELEEEEELAALPEPEPQKVLPRYHEESPLELTQKIEELRATILEKLDAMTELKSKLRKEYVPSTVCTSLEQCIKETEVEIQKLQGQKDFFDSNIKDMEKDLQEAIESADTTERDAKRVWNKVSEVKKSLDRSHHRALSKVDDSDEVDDEVKWNWYIS